MLELPRSETLCLYDIAGLVTRSLDGLADCARNVDAAMVWKLQTLRHHARNDGWKCRNKMSPLTGMRMSKLRLAVADMGCTNRL